MKKDVKISDASRQKRRKNKANKTVLVFDEKKREEFLTGFSKRKTHRRKIAQEEVIRQLKEEKRNKRKQIREARNVEVHSKHCQPIPDMDSLVEKQTYNLAEHTVTVTDVTSVDFVGSGGYMLGANQLDQEQEDKEEKKSQSGHESSDSDRPGSSEKTNPTGQKPKFNPNRHKNLSHLMGKKGKKTKHPEPKMKTKQKRKPRNPTS